MRSIVNQTTGIYRIILLLITIILLVIFLSIKIYTDINAIKQESNTLLKNITLAYSHALPILNNIESVAETLQNQGNLTNRAYAKLLKMGPLLSKLKKNKPHISLLPNKNLSLLHQQTLAYINNARSLYDENMRRADESGGNCR